MIRKARKKPVEIEFIQYIGSNKQELYDWSNEVIHLAYESSDTYVLVVNTLEGTMTVNLNDYIVKGVNGEFYAVKPDVFEKTYDILESNKHKENDISEVKEKAKAFDEIKELINWFEENDRYEFEGQVEEITKIIKVLESECHE